MVCCPYRKPKTAVQSTFTGIVGSPILSGHPRQTYRSTLALAERLCRKTDRIDPTRVRRPCDRLGRGAPTPDSASLCPLLQRSANAPLVGQRCAPLAPGPADRQHHVICSPWWTASPLPPSLSFWYTQLSFRSSTGRAAAPHLDSERFRSGPRT